MKSILVLLMTMLSFTSCAQQTPAKPLPKFELHEDFINSSRHPTCDRVPYFYGSDDKGMWRSDGCSRVYINNNSLDPLQEKVSK